MDVDLPKREGQATRLDVDLPSVLEPVQADLVRVRDAFVGIVADVSEEAATMVKSAAAFSGKQLRPALTCLAARVAGGGVDDDVATVAAIVELIHTATLVHDDILDSADLRRERKTLNAKWGEQAAVLVGDVLFSKAYRTASYLDDRFASQHLADAVGEVLEGEILQDVLAVDVDDQDHSDLDAAEHQYRRIIRGKTAALYDAALQVGAHYGGATETVRETLGRYGHHVGMAFQIVDDRLDLSGDEARVGKSLGRDISEGKLTLPMICWLREQTDASRAKAEALLSRARTDEAAAAELLAAIKDSKALSATDDAARHECEQARAVLAEFSGAADQEAVVCLDAIAAFVLRRTY